MAARCFPGLPHGWCGVRSCGTAVVLVLTLAACGGVTRARPSPSAPSAAAPAPPPSPLASPLVTASWPVYHQNPERTGISENTPAPASLTVGWRARLDGAVYGQPLAVAGEILAATENDTVYALSPATGAILWSTHLGTPVEGGLPCGDILPLGITGTVAYDPLTETLFAVAEEAGFRHILYGLDPLSGAVRWSRRVDIQIPSEDPAAVQQRPALAIANGYVYIGFGGLDGDCAQYRGAVEAIPTGGNGATLTYVVPTAREGAVWATGGPVVEPDGNLLVSTGNGAAFSGAWDHTDSVLELSPTLGLVAAFAPSRWGYDNAHDLDLGSVSPTILPDGYVFIAGKSGVGYVLRQSSLGGVGGQVASGITCLGQMAFGGTAVEQDVVYLPCANGVQSVAVAAGGSFSVLWSTGCGANGPPVLGGGAVFSVDTNTGVLFALSQSSGQVLAHLPIGLVPHFTSPSLVGSDAYVGTDSGVVMVQGA